MEKISVIIPMYNSEKTIVPLLEELQKELQLLEDFDYEILLINDAGPDNVLEVSIEFAQNNPRITIVDLMKNIGQADAMFVGYKMCSGEYIVSMDDDFQHPPSAIIEMINKIKKDNLDVVFARFKVPKRTLLRQIGSKCNQFLARLLINKPKEVSTNSFFVMRSNVNKGIITYTHRLPNIYGLIFATTSRVGNIDVEHRKRFSGQSNYNFFSLLKFLFSNMFGFSSKMLNLVITSGFCVVGISILTLVFLILDIIVNGYAEVRGWTSIISTIIFFAGIQLISIGFVGKYVEQVYRTQGNISAFSIRETYNFKEKNK